MVGAPHEQILGFDNLFCMKLLIDSATNGLTFVLIDFFFNQSIPDTPEDSAPVQAQDAGGQQSEQSVGGGGGNPVAPAGVNPGKYCQ